MTNIDPSGERIDLHGDLPAGVFATLFSGMVSITLVIEIIQSLEINALFCLCVAPILMVFLTLALLSFGIGMLFVQQKWESRGDGYDNGN